MTHNNVPESSQSSGSQALESQGPSPFVTRRVHQLDDGTLAVWSSRHHRKDLPVPESLVVRAIRRAFRRCWWMLDDLNWRIGLLFVMGSALFILGSALTLWPSLVGNEVLVPTRLFFIGSLPFTLAAYLQFYQAVNSTDYPSNESLPVQPRLLGLRAAEIGWWSCMLQLLGTLLFNVSTYNAMDSRLAWMSQDVWVWTPNMMGSILFLASGYMAFAETCHAYYRWLPGNLSWWVVALNLAGCIGFFVSAILAVMVSDADPALRSEFSVWFTLQGAIGFLLGSLLLMPEAATEGDKHPSPVLPGQEPLR